MSKKLDLVVDEKTNMVFKRDISIGKLHQNNIEITSGLNANEIIVTSGIQNLNNGSLVNFN